MTTINNGTINNLVNYVKENSNDTGVTYDADKLSELFAETKYYNAGEEGAAQLDEQIKNLEAAVKALKARAEAMQDDIDECNEKIEGKGEEINEIVGQIGKKSTEYKNDIEKAAKDATTRAISQYKTSDGSEPFDVIFNRYMQAGISGLSADKAAIAQLQDEYMSIQGELKPVLATVETLISETKSLQTQLDTTNSTINMLNATKENMSQKMVNAYTNVDTDNRIPQYTGAKADIANEILGKYTSRYDANDVTQADNGANAGRAQGEYTAEQKALMDSFIEQKNGAKYTSGDKYSAQSNPELMNLRGLYEGGMIDKLQEAGLSSAEILDFVSSNWDVGVTKKGENSYQIPYGHSSDAWVKEGVYAKLSDLCNNSAEAVTADGVNQAQMQELKTAVEKDGVLTKMYKAGFTFKEAMYALTKAFPDAGITYDISNQQERNYGKVADSAESGTLYSTIGTQILDYWNVGATQQTKESDTPITSSRFDPITFQQGDTTYTFINDRDGDDNFDYVDGENNDLMGSKDGMAELLAYDTDGDGKISGDELKNLILMSNKQEESVANNNDVDGYKKGADYKGKGAYTNSVDFNVTYTSAADLGIEEIDLSGFMQDGQYKDLTGTGEDISNSTRSSYDSVTEGYDDINGSSVINQFNIKMKDGSNVTAKETLNTAENLETFYKSIADSADTNSNKIFSSLSMEQFNELLDKDSSDDIPGIRDTLDKNLEQLEDIKDKIKVIDEIKPEDLKDLDEVEKEAIDRNKATGEIEADKIDRDKRAEEEDDDDIDAPNKEIPVTDEKGPQDDPVVPDEPEVPEVPEAPEEPEEPTVPDEPEEPEMPEEPVDIPCEDEDDLDSTDQAITGRH